MLFLALRILLSVAFAQTLRFAQLRTGRTLAVALVNYGVAALICGAIAWSLGGHSLSSSTLWLAVAGGTTYFTSLVLLLPAMREAGVAITGAIFQLSLMVPLSLAICRYGEQATPYRIAGIALSLISLPILSASTAVTRSERRFRWSLSLPLLFVSSGLSHTVMKELAFQHPTTAERFGFMAFLFLVSGIGTGLWVGWGPGRAELRAGPANGPARASLRRVDWLVGVPLGLLNCGQLICLLLALHHLDALVVFPVSSSLGVVVNVVTARALWGERPTRAAWAGIVLAVAAVVLLNL
jgi:drug/metabolite transporter (DMT)-like permease